MTDAIRPMIAGKWKRNGVRASLGEFEAMRAGASEVADKADLLVCPPATLIAAFVERAGGSRAVAVGAQDCHTKASGHHTGDMSAEMLADAGASAIIVGHSERGADHGETDVLVRHKTEAVWRAGLTAIVCIGETQRQRDAGHTLDICRGQLNVSLPDGARADNLVVAYEPVWAIGTGLTPTAEDVEQIHQFIRELLTARFNQEGAGIRILYGGCATSTEANPRFVAAPHRSAPAAGSTRISCSCVSEYYT